MGEDVDYTPLAARVARFGRPHRLSQPRRQTRTSQAHGMAARRLPSISGRRGRLARPADGSSNKRDRACTPSRRCAVTTPPSRAAPPPAPTLSLRGTHARSAERGGGARASPRAPPLHGRRAPSPARPSPLCRPPFGVPTVARLSLTSWARRAAVRGPPSPSGRPAPVSGNPGIGSMTGGGDVQRQHWGSSEAGGRGRGERRLPSTGTCQPTGTAVTAAASAAVGGGSGRGGSTEAGYSTGRAAANGPPRRGRAGGSARAGGWRAGAARCRPQRRPPTGRRLPSWKATRGMDGTAGTPARGVQPGGCRQNRHAAVGGPSDGGSVAPDPPSSQRLRAQTRVNGWKLLPNFGVGRLRGALSGRRHRGRPLGRIAAYLR